jgi:hypothetical protein
VSRRIVKSRSGKSRSGKSSFGKSSFGKSRTCGAGDLGMQPEIGAARAQHLALSRHILHVAGGSRSVTVNDAESPLIWLARRSGR